MLMKKKKTSVTFQFSKFQQLQSFVRVIWEDTLERQFRRSLQKKGHFEDRIFEKISSTPIGMTPKWLLNAAACKSELSLCFPLRSLVFQIIEVCFPHTVEW